MEKPTINVLLIGECGIGKSTFINAFVNYIECDSFDVAANNKVSCIIPTNFTITDDDYEEHTIQLPNNNGEITDSATRETNSYRFEINRNGIGVSIRFVDTPGLGDAKGLDFDNANIERSFHHIAKYGKIHAVCFLLRPNNARSTVMFQYCLNQVLNRLEEDTLQNIMFVFTNTRSTFYSPGDTMTALKEALDVARNKSPYMNIPLNRDNIFCLDNEAFRYLAALENGIQLDGREYYAQSWNHSIQEYWRLIDTIIGRVGFDMHAPIPKQLAREGRYGIPQPSLQNIHPEQVNLLNNPAENRFNTDPSQSKKIKPNNDFIDKNIPKSIIDPVASTSFVSSANIAQNVPNSANKEDPINILLLGESSTGKSTFINAFANYLNYENLHTAERNKVHCVVPLKFTIMDDNFEERVIQIGNGDGSSEAFESATQETRSYKFPIDRNGINTIRFIDTPGLGDARGLAQDKINIDNTVELIRRHEKIHAICIFLKPDNSRFTASFQYCITQILSKLEKNASKNIMFVFTNTRSTFYEPSGDSMVALKEVLDTIKKKSQSFEIPLVKDNIFCLDNEAFRYLAAANEGIHLAGQEYFDQSWSISVRESLRLIDSVIRRRDAIIPLPVQDTVAANEASLLIIQLSQPLIDVLELINDNIKALKYHRHLLCNNVRNVNDLKENFYVPVVCLEIEELEKPALVCTSAKCREAYKVFQSVKYNYKQMCAVPCSLKNKAIGAQELTTCQVMKNGKCQKCSCDCKMHMNICYRIASCERRLVYETAKGKINDETALKYKKALITEIDERILLQKQETDVLIETMAKLGHFLQQNTILPYDDYFREYIQNLIRREMLQPQDHNTQLVCDEYREFARLYDKEKSAGLRDSLNLSATFTSDCYQIICQLKWVGEQIKKLHSAYAKEQNTSSSDKTSDSDINQSKRIDERIMTNNNLPTTYIVAEEHNSALGDSGLRNNSNICLPGPLTHPVSTNLHQPVGTTNAPYLKQNITISTTKETTKTAGKVIIPRTPMRPLGSETKEISVKDKRNVPKLPDPPQPFGEQNLQEFHGRKKDFRNTNALLNNEHKSLNNNLQLNKKHSDNVMANMNANKNPDIQRPLANTNYTTNQEYTQKNKANDNKIPAVLGWTGSKSQKPLNKGVQSTEQNQMPHKSDNYNNNNNIKDKKWASKKKGEFPGRGSTSNTIWYGVITTPPTTRSPDSQLNQDKFHSNEPSTSRYDSPGIDVNNSLIQPTKKKKKKLCFC